MEDSFGLPWETSNINGLFKSELVGESLKGILCSFQNLITFLLISVETVIP